MVPKHTRGTCRCPGSQPATGMLHAADLPTGGMGMRLRRALVEQSGAWADAFMAPARVAALPLPISLLVLCFAYWCVDIVSPALPTIQESLALSATGAGLVFSV